MKFCSAALVAFIWLLVPPVSADSTVVFNEIMYHPNATNEASLEWVELYNQMAVDMDISGWSLAGGAQFTFPEGTVLGGGRHLIVASSPATLTALTGVANVFGPFTGRLSNDGDTLELRNNNQRLMDVLTYGVEGDWPVGADGAGVSLAKGSPDAGSVAPASWTVSAHVGGTPGAPNFSENRPVALVTNLLPIGATWRYEQSGANLGTSWSQPSFDDRTWGIGSGVLAVENCGCLPEPIRTALTIGATNYYFRTRFNFSGDPATASIQIRYLIDDGAVIYLNGAEVWRIGLPAGPVAYTNFTDRSVDNAVYEGPFTIPSGALVRGSNVLAVEVHQNLPASTDIVLGLEVNESHTVDPSNAGAGVVPVAFNELESATNANFWIELINYGKTNVTLDGCTIARLGGAYREFSFNGVTLAPGAFQLVSRATLGFSADPGDRLLLYAPGRSNVLDGVVAKRTPRARMPDATGQWLIPTQLTPGASNAVVLRDELVINEIMYNHRPSPVTKAESPESWIELFNRSTHAVNLAGWKLADGIEFSFASDQSIPAGGYLVIAKDPAFLQSLYPGLNVLGPFDKSLSRRSDRIVLEDPSGNPADQVRYFAEGRWPRYAHGGGSSLELQDPRADNAQAEAWAASDESGKASWVSYSYRGIASAEPAPSPTAWNEFVLGLIEAGEVLLDDISVIESPSGAATQLIQNGSFESGLGAWRILGNHKGSVIIDPDNGGNRVLRLVATGETEHMHNHAETTLAGGVSIVNGREYQISFRAKWIGGNNALLTRLYFNRLPRVTPLGVPALNGTPGAVNSRSTPNLGPTYTGMRHSPAVPAPGNPVPVFVQAADPDGVTNVVLRWTANGGAWNQATMEAQPAGGYLANLPAHTAGTLVQFYVEGTDGRGAKSTYPAGGANARALFRVNDNLAVFDALHNVRILMTAADTTFLHAPTNVMSNDGMGATLIYNETQVFYDVRLHLRGSERGRNDPARVAFTIHFNPDQPFRGVHESITFDRQGWFSLGGNHEEILIKHMINHAGGLPGMYDDLVHIIAPRAQQNGTSLMLMGRYSDEFLDTQYRNGGDGDLFKLELIYYMASTADGSPQGLKIPYPSPDGVLGVDFQNLGNNQEAYRWNFLKENNQAQDRWDQLMAVAKLFSLSGSSIDAPSQKLLDVNEWCRAFAIESLCGLGDTYGFGLQHNFMIYFRPEDGKALAFPWDMDISFSSPTSSPLLPGANVAKLFTLPANQRLFYSHLYDLVTTTYNTAYMSRWTAHYSGLLRQDWSRINDYINNRRTYVLSQLPTATAFAITFNGGNNFSTGNNLVTLTGTAPIQVEYIEVNGIRYAIRWTSTTAWSLAVPVPNGTTTLTLQALDRYGRPLNNVTDTITVTNTSEVPPPQGWVLLNEIHYHAPQEGGGFVELHNRHPSVSFDLSLWRLEGASCVLPHGSVLRPGGFLVVAGDTNAFTLIYTNAPLPTAGYAGNLQNNGELLKLVRPLTPSLDEVVDAVRYSDRAPWPTDADGSGASLQVIDPTLERTRVANWAAAAPTPGARNSVSATLTPPPPLWLNELLVFNTQGPTDNAGELEPWIELFNRGSISVSLNGLFLTDNLSNLTQWALPAGDSLAASEFRVIHADGEPGEETAAALHTNFRLTNSAGVIALVRTNAGRIEVIDYVEYSGLTPNRAFGSWPDGQPVDRQIFYYATPGAPNNSAAAPVPVVINEFSADNAGPGGLRDPLDGLFQDWFELFNPNPTPFDLSGYFLTDTLMQPKKWPIPLGTSLGGHDFLLVWADNQPEQTGLSLSGDLHVNFALNADGEAIALFAPDGTLQSSVVFGQQFQNVTMGLFPEGSTNAGYQLMTNWTARAANQLGMPPGARLLGFSPASDGMVSLALDVLPGRTYQLEYKDELAAPAWTLLGPSRTATGPTLTIPNLQIDSAKRFYRAVLLP